MNVVVRAELLAPLEQLTVGRNNPPIFKKVSLMKLSERNIRSLLLKRTIRAHSFVLKLDDNGTNKLKRGILHLDMTGRLESLDRDTYAKMKKKGWTAYEENLAVYLK